jgi:hypothetical protein
VQVPILPVEDDHLLAKVNHEVEQQESNWYEQ